MHAPANSRHAPLGPLPDSNDDPLPPSPVISPVRTPALVPAAPFNRRRPVPSNPTAQCRSSRKTTAPDRLGTWAKTTGVADVGEPKTWKQMMCLPHKDIWLKAIDEELLSLVGMKMWKLGPRPAKRKIIRSKCVFKVKRRPDRSILKLKARLVAMGYTQEKGIDYNELFALTTRLETLRLVLSLLASKDWEGWQIDFKIAFLNSKLDTTIYMTQPPGMEDPSNLDHVCEVLNSLYGLKQSPRLWNRQLHAAFLSLGLIQSKFDPTLYHMLKNN